MATLTNLSRQPVALPTGHVVPRLGTLTTSNDLLRCPDNAPTLAALVTSGVLTVAYDPDPAPDPDPVPDTVVTPAPPATTSADPTADAPQLAPSKPTEPPVQGKKGA